MSGCLHEATGTMTLQYCRDCGDVRLDDEWTPDPVMLTALKATAAKVMARKWREAYETLRIERNRLRKIVEIADCVVDRRDPEQWSLNHDAFVNLGVALDQLAIDDALGTDVGSVIGAPDIKEERERPRDG